MSSREARPLRAPALAAAITARGVVSAFGAGEEALWQGLLSGETRVLQSAALGFPAAAVPAAALGRSPPAADRTVALAQEAAHQIRESPAWQRVRPERLGVCLGTTQGPIESWQQSQERLASDAAFRPPPPGLFEPARAVAELLGAGGPLECPSMACASGTAAIGVGLSWLRRGLCEAVVAGGADALSGFVHAGFTALRAVDPEVPRPFDRDRAGLGAGEGAALLLLEPVDGAVAAAVAAAPRVLGWGLSADANHLTGPDPRGGGVARGIEQALGDAGLTAAELDFVSAHGTATRYNDLMEAHALSTVLGERCARVPVSSIKGAIGHSMAAAGAIEAVVCCLVIERGLVPPTAGLLHQDPEIHLDVVRGSPRPGRFRRAVSTSSGFGGINAALVIAAGNG